MNLSAYQLLNAVHPAELGKFSVSGPRGRVVRERGWEDHRTRRYGKDTAMDTRGAVVLRENARAWEVGKSFWEPPPRRRAFKSRFMRLFKWKKGLRRRRRRRRAKRTLAATREEDDDDDWEESEEEEPSSKSNQDAPAEVTRGYIDERKSVPLVENEIDAARDSFSNNKRASIIRRIPRQFSLDFHDKNDLSIRELPKVAARGERVTRLPRGVPFRPVNRRRKEAEAAVSIEHLTPSSSESRSISSRSHGSSRASSACSGSVRAPTPPMRRMESRSAEKVSHMSSYERMMKEETSTVSSDRTSGASKELSSREKGTRDAAAEANAEEDLHETSQVSLEGCSASKALVRSAQKRHRIAPRAGEGLYAREVSLYDDDFISFCCNAKHPKSRFTLKSKYDSAKNKKTSNKKFSNGRDINFIRRLFVRNRT